MAVRGYVTHAAYNRRLTVALAAAYVVAFEVIAVFCLTWFLLMWDHEHTVLSNPAGYALRYALPVAAVTALVFWGLYRGHADAVARSLDIRLVDRAQEPRFVAIAEEQCTALGVRLPRFGIIEAAEPNALTVGEGPNAGLIAVTRGLLTTLDDDELAAVLAHEASHIRHGDTRVLAANHALMRTAVILQTHNILRLEDWRQLVIPILLPPTLPLFLLSGFATMSSLRLARFARRGLKLSRDHIADGEAVRVTQFPDALISALGKVSGRGGFPNSDKVEGLLFDGQADHEGGSHPTLRDRIDAITGLAGNLMNPARLRRDTRAAPSRGGGRSVFGLRSTSGVGQRVGAAGPLPAADLPPLDKPSLATLALFFTDRDKFWRWQNACIDSQEWRADEKRNLFGFKPNMAMPLLAAVTVMCWIYWPRNGDLSQFGRTMSPAALVDIAREVNGGPFCQGSGCPAHLKQRQLTGTFGTAKP